MDYYSSESVNKIRERQIKIILNPEKSAGVA